MLPSRETNQGEPNGKIGISNSVAANLWCQLRQAYVHNHSIIYQVLPMHSNLIEAYKQGMQVYSQCHPQTVRSLFDAFCSELSEFRAEPSQEEAWDVLHSFGRLTWKLTGIPLFWLAKPTVEKHGHRFAESGCIRSSRNCLGNCCQKNSNG